MRITLNLATRPFTDIGPAIKRLRVGMAVLAALCLLFFLGLHLFDRQAEAARAREHSLDGDLARVRAERRQALETMQQPDNARLLNQTEFLNQRFDEKAFSWTLAMEAMETVLPAGVQVTSIEPLRGKDGHITVELRVLGPHDQSVNLVRNLEHSRRFLQPRIEGESAESSTNSSQRLDPIGPANRFEFDLFADYNPPTHEERADSRTTASNSEPGSPVPSPHRRALPALPRQPGRQPYTGPARPVSKPSPAANGGSQ